jgi:hypothetical protein
MIANAPPYYHCSPKDRPVEECRLTLRTVLVFFSARALRGGPRLLVQIAVTAVLLGLLARLLPEPVSDIAFGTSYSNLWRWPFAQIGGEEDGGGGLRIVVFGSSDVASPSVVRQLEGNEDTATGKSWMEYLCEEVTFLALLEYVRY